MNNELRAGYPLLIFASVVPSERTKLTLPKVFVEGIY